MTILVLIVKIKYKTVPNVKAIDFYKLTNFITLNVFARMDNLMMELMNFVKVNYNQISLDCSY